MTNGDTRIVLIHACEKAADEIRAFWIDALASESAAKFDPAVATRALFSDLWLLPPNSTHEFLKSLTADVHEWPKVSEALTVMAADVILHQLRQDCAENPGVLDQCTSLLNRSVAQAVARINMASIQELDALLRMQKEEYQSTVEEIRSMNEELRTANEEISTSLEEVRRYKDRLELMTSQASDAILVVDAPSYQIIDANRKAEELFGWSRNQMLGSSLVRLCLASHLQLLFGRLDKLGSGGQIRFDDIPFVAKDQKDFPVEASVARVHANDRSIFFMILRDTFARRQTEEALVRAKEDWENTFDAITDLVMLLDGNQRILRVNKAAAETLNTTKEALIGKKCYQVVHGLNHPIRHCPMAVTMRNLKPHTREITMPNIGRTFICATGPMLDREGNVLGYTHTLKDITESKELEMRLYEAQKMEAVATLAGGIAHDFNNLLMGIQGYVSLILNDLDTSHTYHHMLERVQDQVRSGADLTRQLLGFARKGKYDVKPADLNAVVRQSLAIFGRARKEIVLREKYQQDLWPAEIDKGQIEQVLLNLYVNAWQAMPAGGDLYVETENTVLGETQARPLKLEPGRYVKVSVTDTGVGMDRATQQRIFDPFFTTKEMGRGTGLGLASAYGIIKNHGGDIGVDSKEGCGSTFTIHLPASEKEVVKETPDQHGKSVPRGNETILLIDDQEIILEVGKELLEELGYTVLLADSGEKAVDLYKNGKEKIDLVIIDMIMPGMDGGETYDILKDINPDVKAVLSTGYSLDGDAAEIMKQGVNAFIQKPFNMKELGEKLRQVLDVH